VGSSSDHGQLKSEPDYDGSEPMELLHKDPNTSISASDGNLREETIDSSASRRRRITSDDGIMDASHHVSVAMDEDVDIEGDVDVDGDSSLVADKNASSDAERIFGSAVTPNAGTSLNVPNPRTREKNRVGSLGSHPPGRSPAPRAAKRSLNLSESQIAVNMTSSNNNNNNNNNNNEKVPTKKKRVHHSNPVNNNNNLPEAGVVKNEVATNLSKGESSGGPGNNNQVRKRNNTDLLTQCLGGFR